VYLEAQNFDRCPHPQLLRPKDGREHASDVSESREKTVIEKVKCSTQGGRHTFIVILDPGKSDFCRSRL
jgi:hypothetical protein